MIEKIKETAAFIKERFPIIPETAIILGTGLGELVNHITDQKELAYKDIPNFPISKDIAESSFSGNWALKTSWQCKADSIFMKVTI